MASDGHDDHGDRSGDRVARGAPMDSGEQEDSDDHSGDRGEVHSDDHGVHSDVHGGEMDNDGRDVLSRCNCLNKFDLHQYVSNYCLHSQQVTRSLNLPVVSVTVMTIVISMMTIMMRFCGAR